MARTRKISSIVRSHMKKHDGYSGNMVGWFYPNQRKLLVREERAIRDTYPAYYMVEVPEEVRIYVRGYSSANSDAVDRDINVSTVGRVIFDDMNIFGVGEITKIEIIGHNRSPKDVEEDRTYHLVRCQYKNGIKLSLEGEYTPDSSYCRGDITVQGTRYWYPRNPQHAPYPKGGESVEDDTLHRYGFGGYDTNKQEIALWG